MNPYSIPAIIVCFLSIIIAVIIYKENPKKKLNISFSLVCIFQAYWTFSDFQIQHTNIRQAAELWIKTGSFFPFFVVFSLYFVLIYTRQITKIYAKFLLIIQIIIAGALSFINIFTNFIRGNIEKVYWGWRYIPKTKDSIFYYLFILWLIISTIIIFTIIIINHLKIKTRIKKQQSFLIMFGFIIPMFALFFTDFILPLFESNIPTMFNIFSIFGTFLIFYGITKYKILRVNPYMAAENIISTMNDSMILVDDKFRIRFFNKALVSLTGIKKNNIRGKNLFNILKFKQNNKHKIQSIFKKDKINSLNSNIQTHTKKNIQISISGSVLKNRNRDKNLGAVFVIRDISEKYELIQERNKLKEDLIQAQKLEAIGKLAGGIAHDFNNSLGAIFIFTQELLDEYSESNSDIKECAENIMAASEHAADLTNKLLAFGRKGKLATAPIDIHKLIKNVIKILERTIDKKIIIEEMFNAEKFIINGNESQIKNAFLNLALNARDAMPDGGKLIFKTSVIDKNLKLKILGLSASSEIDYLLLEVIDNGIGMNKETLTRIFEPFFTTKSSGKGTGLGLSSVYGTVKNHNGLIRVESKEKTGSIFKVFLPLIFEETKEETKENLKEKNIQIKKGHGNILIIDDEKMILSAYKQFFKKTDFEANYFDNGFDAIDYYKKNHMNIDLIILDLIMPEISGTECFFKLIKIDSNVKILLASGYAKNDEATHLLKNGASSFIKKPFHKKQLAKIIEKII